METKVKLCEKNFETLLRAIKDNKIALVECFNTVKQEKVAIICAFNIEEDGDYSFVPFAEMLEGNPYEYLEPPTTTDEK
jgi:hypothetical protein